MGWRGFVRSVNASSRRAAIASERRSRALARAHSKADNVLARLDAEIEREIQKVGAWEEKVSGSPIKALKLSYERGGGWSTEPLKDRTGLVTYTLTFEPASLDGALFDTISADLDGGIVLTPLAAAVCSQFTAVAFWAALGGDAAKNIRLFQKASPETSRIAKEAP